VQTFLAETATHDTVTGLDRKVALKELKNSPELLALVNAAKMKEWNSFRENGVLEPITDLEFRTLVRGTDLKAMNMRWVLDYKIIDGRKGIKARLVAQGTEHQDKRIGVVTDVALPHHRALRFLLAWQLAQDEWNPQESILQADLKTAFLQAENLSDEVFVRRPKDTGATTPEEALMVNAMFGNTGIARAVKTLYGTRDAPANLDVAVRASLAERGFVESLACPNLWLRLTAKGVPYRSLPTELSQRRNLMREKGVVIDSWVFVYVDDLLVGTGLTASSDVLLEIQGRWKLKGDPSPPSVFLGIHFDIRDWGIFWSQPALAQQLRDRVKHLVKNPLENLPLPREVSVIENQIDNELKRGEFLSERQQTHTRTDLLYTQSFFGTWTAQATPAALSHLRRACLYAGDTYDLGLQFTRKGETLCTAGNFACVQPSVASKDRGWTAHEPCLWNVHVFTDATYTKGDDRAMAGTIVCLNDMVMSARASRLRRKAHSSARAELMTLYDSIDVALAFVHLLREFQIAPGDIGVTVWCDALNCVAATHSRNPRNTEEIGELQARQLAHIFSKDGFPIDRLRKHDPALALALELVGAPRVTLAYDDGTGYRTRYEHLELLTELDEEDINHAISAADSLRDGQMRLVHLDGVNQIADALTKMNVHVDLHGRTVFSRTCFLDRRATPMRALPGEHVRVRGPAQLSQRPKGEPMPPLQAGEVPGPAKHTHADQKTVMDNHDATHAVLMGPVQPDD